MLVSAFIPYIFFHFQRAFSVYERESYGKLISDIEAEPSEKVQAMVKSFLHNSQKYLQEEKVVAYGLGICKNMAETLVFLIYLTCWRTFVDK